MDQQNAKHGERENKSGRMPFGYVLGVDIGANSIGWAALELGPEGEPIGLAKSPRSMVPIGVRIFQAGVDRYGEGDKEESRNAQRRAARLRRRQTYRRARRLKKTFRLLQDAGLLPAFAPDRDPDERIARDRLIKDLDARLSRVWAERVPADERRVAMERLPYLLRARALDHKLEPFELGRAIYHLAQRRGFQSNRRAAFKKDEKPGQVKSAIEGLAKEMAAARARTLGEYFAKADPAAVPIRRRWTSRAMYRDEFEAIWKAQESYNPGLGSLMVGVPRFNEGKVEKVPAKLVDALRKALFRQRSILSQRRSIGKCELEPGAKRVPACFPEAQRFRMLQKVNDLRYLPPDGEQYIPLTPDQRGILLPYFEKKSKVSFEEIRRALGLQGSRFNLERGGEKGLPGCSTEAKLRAVFDKRWEGLTAEEKFAAVVELWSIERPETLRRRVAERRGVWGKLQATEADAEKTAELGLEEGYLSLSRKAIRKLLPLMEEGKSFIEARDAVYPPPAISKAEDLLPPVEEALGKIRNPVVERALTELRRVVNAIVRTLGKPALIRVELARDLKRTRSQRYELMKRMRKNESARNDAREQLARAGHRDASGGDLIRWRLWNECGKVCPYTGKAISMGDLLSGQVEIEHIIPFSRCLDDSYMNKTLCFAEENRNYKRDRTPYEAYGSNRDRWEEIIGRMQRNVSNHKMPREKLRRFQLRGKELEEFISQFASRQLNDTRYASVRAREFLSTLYGGRLAQGVDSEGKLRVQVGAGEMTAYLRGELGLNSILGDGGTKSRDDHRHHAVDAVAIALTSPAMVQRLNRAAALPAIVRRVDGHVRRFGRVDPPWPTFHAQVRDAVERVWASHRITRRVRGSLHKETNYSPPKKDRDRLVSHIRCNVRSLKPKDVDQIVDPVVREAVKRKLEESGQTDPAKAFDPARPETLPTLRGAPGAAKVRRVRVRKANLTVQVGQGCHARYVESGANHHVEILEYKDAKGNVRWEGKVVSVQEAVRRKAAGEPVVRRVHEPGKRFLFSLCNGDAIELESDGEATKLKKGGEARGLFVVTTISRFATGTIHIEFAANRDARPKKLRERKGFTKTPDKLRQRGCRKVILTPLGELRPASE